MKNSLPKHEKINNKKKTRPIILLISAALLTAALITGFTFSKYVHIWQADPAQADAMAFYFSSDLLKDPSENAVYYIDPQTKSFSITLSNADNSLRITKEDIVFSAQAEGAEVKVDQNTIAGGAKNALTIEVIPANGASEIKVSAQASAPYVKKLAATFKLAAGNQFAIDDKEGNNAAVLTLTCADAAKNITISLPNGVMPDETDARIKSDDKGGFVFVSPGPGVYSLVLLKQNNMADLSKGETPFSDSIEVSG